MGGSGAWVFRPTPSQLNLGEQRDRQRGRGRGWREPMPLKAVWEAGLGLCRCCEHCGQSWGHPAGTPRGRGARPEPRRRPVLAGSLLAPGFLLDSCWASSGSLRFGNVCAGGSGDVGRCHGEATLGTQHAQKPVLPPPLTFRLCPYKGWIPSDWPWQGKAETGGGWGRDHPWGSSMSVWQGPGGEQGHPRRGGRPQVHLRQPPCAALVRLGCPRCLNHSLAVRSSGPPPLSHG